MSHQRINRFVKALVSDDDALAALKANPVAMFDKFGLSDHERACFLEPSGQSLAEAGVHPLQRYRLLRVLGVVSSQRPPLSYYIDRLED